MQRPAHELACEPALRERTRPGSCVSHHHIITLSHHHIITSSCKSVCRYVYKSVCVGKYVWIYSHTRRHARTHARTNTHTHTHAHTHTHLAARWCEKRRAFDRRARAEVTFADTCSLICVHVSHHHVHMYHIIIWHSNPVCPCRRHLLPVDIRHTYGLTAKSARPLPRRHIIICI